MVVALVMAIEQRREGVPLRSTIAANNAVTVTITVTLSIIVPISTTFTISVTAALSSTVPVSITGTVDMQAKADEWNVVGQLNRTPVRDWYQ